MPKTLTLAEAQRAFWAVQSKYAEFGAADTEPSWEFEKLIDAARAGQLVRLPRTIDDWQLFDREILGYPGAGKAARALTAAAKVAVAAAHREWRVNGIPAVAW